MKASKTTDKELQAEAKEYLKNYIEPILKDGPRWAGNVAQLGNPNFSKPEFALLVQSYVAMVSGDQQSRKNFWLSVALFAFTAVSATAAFVQAFHW